MTDDQHDEPSGDEAQDAATSLPSPADVETEQLRDALGSMRDEADRIATLGTGQEQVEAAEQFADGAGRLDEQIGAAARAADDDRNS
jgi:hypothetical protein